MAQTTVKSRTAIRKGSAKIEIGKRRDLLSNIGAARSISLKETLTITDIESDNAGVIDTIVSAHTMEITLSGLEIDFEKIKDIRGGIDKFTYHDGETEVEKKERINNDGCYEIGETISIPDKNADGTPVVIFDVEAEADDETRTLELDKDYELVGTNAIKIISNDVDPDLDTLIIHYKITPKLMNEMTTGGGDASIKPQWLILTNTNAEGKEFRILCPKTSVSGGLELPFPSDTATDVMVTPWTFTVNLATGEDSYEQLARFEDEQNVFKKSVTTTTTTDTEPVLNLKDNTLYLGDNIITEDTLYNDKLYIGGTGLENVGKKLFDSKLYDGAELSVGLCLFYNSLYEDGIKTTGYKLYEGTLYLDGVIAAGEHTYDGIDYTDGSLSSAG